MGSFQIWCDESPRPWGNCIARDSCEQSLWGRHCTRQSRSCRRHRSGIPNHHAAWSSGRVERLNPLARRSTARGP